MIQELYTENDNIKEKEKRRINEIPHFLRVVTQRAKQIQFNYG